MSKEKKEKPKYIINYSEGKGLLVRLRGKVLSTSKKEKSKISLYLDYYQGFSKTDEIINIGKESERQKIKTFRKVEYLKMYLFANPSTPQERTKNDEVLNIAISIRNNRESDIMHKPQGLIAPYKKNINFFDFCNSYIDTYNKKDVRMIKQSIAKFKEYTNKSFIKPSEIDSKLIKGFVDFLNTQYNGETPHSMYQRFKKVISEAKNDGLFTENPTTLIKCNRPKYDAIIGKEILSPDEVVRLYNTECSNIEIKRAFLFCLNTGLRFVDVNEIRYDSIKQDNKLIFTQQKTASKVTIDLNKNALNIIGEPKTPKEKIFILPSFVTCLKTIKTWCKDADINRNITWHSARHSFATMLLLNKVDIKTVGSLLGHSKIEHTQKYTHVVDEIKKNAVATLPEYK